MPLRSRLISNTLPGVWYDVRFVCGNTLIRHPRKNSDVCRPCRCQVVAVAFGLHDKRILTFKNEALVSGLVFDTTAQSNTFESRLHQGFLD